MSKKNRITCPFCSLHCTDLRMSIDGGRLASFSPPCILGENGFRNSIAELADEPVAKTAHIKSLRTIWEWLPDARQPLMVLSSDLESETVTAAVQLARQHSAILTC